MPNEVFLTGATGYIGSHLLKTWLEKTDQRINLLVRRRRNLSPQDRIAMAMRDIDAASLLNKLKDRIGIVEGDVSQDSLGMNQSDFDALTGNVSEIIHCAAAARFDLSLEDARKTNVDGVNNLITLAAKCSGLKRFDYVGTAYVAGERSGLVLESQLATVPSHRNTYEQSKFEAEALLREWMDRLPITVSRPSIVICDSRTGKASNHNGFYRALKAYMLYGLSMLPGEADSVLDLVPVDYVCEALFRISRDPESIGRYYHLAAGSNATTLGEIQKLSSQYSGRPKFNIVSHESFMEFLSKAGAVMTEEQFKAIEEMQRYEPYLHCHSTFDTTNTIRDTHLQAPMVGDYFHKFAEQILAESSRMA